jgi:hypothetical protein
MKKRLALIYAAIKLFIKLRVWEKIVAAVKSPAGVSVMRSLPGLIAFALISVGAGLIFLPAGFIVGGVLLLVDRAM